MVDGDLCQFDVLELSLGQLRGVDHVERAHGFEHEVTAFDGPFQVPCRRQGVGRRKHADQSGGLRQSQVRDVFAEVPGRRFAESVDRERSAMAQVHLVGVHREDLLLGEPLFQNQRHEDFGQLPVPGAVVAVQKEAAGQLHGERAGPLSVHAPEIGIRRPGPSNQVDPEMPVEPLILGGNNGAGQIRRELLPCQKTALGAGVVEQGGYQLGRQIDSIHPESREDLGRGSEPTPLKVQAIVRPFFGRNQNRGAFFSDGHPIDGIPIQVFIPLFEPGPPQTQGDFPDRDPLAGIQYVRGGVNPRGIGKDFTVEAAIDDGGVGSVVPHEHGARHDGGDDDECAKNLEPCGSKDGPRFSLGRFALLFARGHKQSSID